MERKILNAIGINANKNIPAEEIFSTAIDKESYGLNEEDISKINALKCFCYQYNSEKPTRKKPYINTPQKAADIMYNILRDLEHEEVWIAYLDRANHLIDKERLFVGGLNQTTIDNKVIARKAVGKKASGIILFHNHPSDKSTPSKSDIEATESLKKVCDILEISLIDHIIISNTEFFSFSNDAVTSLIDINEKNSIQKPMQQARS